ncbi:MAG: ABC transporter permease [Vicinamibacterales bacterium]
MFAEFRFAARSLARWRGGALAAGLTLAIGVGLTVALSALVRVLLPDLPGVPDLGQLGRVYASSQTLGVERSPVTLHEFDATVSKATSFSGIGAYADEDATIGAGSDVRSVVAGYASPGFFTAMGVAPEAGRVFSGSDLQQPVVILGDALWRREFPDGRLTNATVTIDGVQRAVIGVMPPAFHYGFVGISADLWVPLGHAARDTPAIVAVYARLRDGVAWPAADAELGRLSHGAAPWIWRAIPVQDDTRYRSVSAYAFTLGPALLVLLIACVNVACMLMARGFARDQELSVRLALGATRARIVRLLLVEHLVLALIGGAIGGGLAVVILRALRHGFSGVQPDLAAQLGVDAGLLPVALAASGLACLLFGVVPALRLSRRNVAASLNGVPPAHRIEIAGYGGRDVIVFAEIASAVGLIVWVALLSTLFAQVQRITFGFAADRVVAMRVPAQDARGVAARVAAIPGVAVTSVSSGMLGGSPVIVEAAGGRSTVLSRVPAGEHLLETLGLPLLRGRWFDRAELDGRSPVVVLSESGARQLADGADALGMRIRISGGRTAVVIGICRDAIDYGALSKAGTFAPADLYVPEAVSDADAVVLARTLSDPHSTLRAIAAAAPLPPGAKVARPTVLSEELGEQRLGSSEGIVVVRILGAFAILTLLLAASGISAVIAQSVAQRTREFGIRLAIGASPRGVLGMVLIREGKLIGTGIVVGLVFTMALTNALFAALVRLGTILPWMWIGALALSAAVATIAVALATYRIVRLEPSAVLRRS